MRDERKKFYSQLVDVLRKADVVIEIVDARFPDETRIEKLERRFGKKMLIAASKSDLVPKECRRAEFLYFSSRTREGIKDLLSKATEIAKANPFRKTREGKLVVFGIPNVGKSSLINALAKRHTSVTGFRAGITRGPQWIRVSEDLMLCDTAGVVNFNEDEKSMALKSAVDVTSLKNPMQTALAIMEKAKTSKKNPILAHYGLKYAEDAEDLLTQIAKKRGILGKGGEPNVSEAAMVLIRDYQKGKFVV